MTSELGSLTDRFSNTSEDMRREAARAVNEIAAEQNRLREQLAVSYTPLPLPTHHTA